MDAIQTLEDLMRRHREEGRAVEYADLVPVLAGLKAQRDELLADLKLIAETDPVDAALDPQRAVRVAVAALAKHKEASHG